MEGEFADEGDGFGAEPAIVFDGKGMVVVVVEDEVFSEHLGVVLAFVAFGPAGGCAGYYVGEVASDAGGYDKGDVPVEAARHRGG